MMRTAPRALDFKSIIRVRQMIVALASVMCFFSTENGSLVRAQDVDLDLPRQVLQHHKYNVRSLAFSPDSKILASASAEKTIALWDLTRKKPAVVGILLGHKDCIQNVAFFAEGKKLLSAALDKRIKVWDVETQTEDERLELTTDSRGNMALTSDGRLLAVGGGKGSPNLWDMEKKGGHDKRVLVGAKGVLQRLVFSSDGQLLATIADDTLRLLKVESDKQLWARSGVSAVAFSPDSSAIATSGGGQIVVYDLITGKEKLTLRPKVGEKFIHLAFFPDDSGFLVAISKRSVSGDDFRRGYRDAHTIHIWDITAKRKLGVTTWGKKEQIKEDVYSDRPQDIWSMAMSPDGKMLAVGCHDGMVVIWDISTIPRLAAKE